MDVRDSDREAPPLQVYCGGHVPRQGARCWCAGRERRTVSMIRVGHRATAQGRLDAIREVLVQPSTQVTTRLFQVEQIRLQDVGGD